MPPPPAQILSAALDGAVLISLRGPMSFHSAPAFRNAALAALRAGASLVAVDMARCASLDSTFMGAIASLAFAFRSAPASRLVFLDLSRESAALLKGLGILPILNAYPTDARPQKLPSLDPLAAILQPIDLAADADAAFILEAHETLARANPDNLRRFRDVIDFLRRDAAR